MVADAGEQVVEPQLELAARDPRVLPEQTVDARGDGRRADLTRQRVGGQERDRGFILAGREVGAVDGGDRSRPGAGEIQALREREAEP